MQNIIISGASGNLGQEVVQKLSALDTHLFVTTGSHYKGEFDALSGVDNFGIDLLDSDASHSFVQKVIDQAETIHAGVFLVGGYAPGGLAETDDEDLEKMIHLNFFTAFHLTKPLIAHFKKQGGGQLIFIGAKGAVSSNQGDANFAYTLSKSLLVKMADMINSEYESEGITATMIVPGIIDTPVNREAMPDADFDKWVPPTDIAESIAFVLSETGQKLRQPVIKIYNQS
ncbi:SDR family NAD(P)-dependent oxidoreductase [Dyadobacter sp. CY312]|uniref:SDR family NAD(P)-dependent oxidoreductase n=1 Tax=Dyadobacter sp. CY312 TaxID=2907303 RepID=UPI001F42BC93|nr:SDR family NAD(P)-dependent oxidoreductase [Dyadobacter sp. CY312]MCE7043537.1 SDR family NAD(P)-dependent oxidoreductase [Dyadobacter sp. CY312]